MNHSAWDGIERRLINWFELYEENMPDFAPNYTARYKLQYSTLGHTHTMLWRGPNTLSDLAAFAPLIEKMGTFLAACEPFLMNDWTILAASYALADSDIFLPAGTPAAPTGAGTATDYKDSQSSLAASFVGRSDHGEKARFFLYGVAFNPFGADLSADFRIHTTEVAAVSEAVGVLSETPPDLIASDNHIVLWYPYINIKYNDYWVKKGR